MTGQTLWSSWNINKSANSKSSAELAGSKDGLVGTKSGIGRSTSFASQRAKGSKDKTTLFVLCLVLLSVTARILI